MCDKTNFYKVVTKNTEEDYAVPDLDKSTVVKRNRYYEESDHCERNEVPSTTCHPGGLKDPSLKELSVASRSTVVNKRIWEDLLSVIFIIALGVFYGYLQVQGGGF